MTTYFIQRRRKRPISRWKPIKSLILGFYINHKLLFLYFIFSLYILFYLLFFWIVLLILSWSSNLSWIFNPFLIIPTYTPIFAQRRFTLLSRIYIYFWKFLFLSSLLSLCLLIMTLVEPFFNISLYYHDPSTSSILPNAHVFQHIIRTNMIPKDGYMIHVSPLISIIICFRRIPYFLYW